MIVRKISIKFLFKKKLKIDQEEIHAYLIYLMEIILIIFINLPNSQNFQIMTYYSNNNKKIKKIKRINTKVIMNLIKKLIYIRYMMVILNIYFYILLSLINITINNNIIYNSYSVFFIE